MIGSSENGSETDEHMHTCERGVEALGTQSSGPVGKARQTLPTLGAEHIYMFKTRQSAK